MESDLLILLTSITLGFIILGYFIRRWLVESNSKDNERQLIGQFLKSFDTRSIEQTKAINERLDKAARVIAQVQKSIGEFSEIGRGIRELQEFLRSPKLRGNIGEEILADLIGQMFPKGKFHLQYSFKSGVRVDVAIETDAGILPIDAKFPLENYQKLVKGETDSERVVAEKEFIRDVKKHIETINKKYIVQDEGTLDFALMYVPSEAVFYHLVQLTEITDYSRQRRVYPVSPTTLYAHLQTILLSFAGRQMEEKSKEIFKLLRAMLADYSKVDESLQVLSKHLGNANNQLQFVSQNFVNLGQKLERTQMIEGDVKQQ